jgi:hypothetical protein
MLSSELFWPRFLAKYAIPVCRQGRAYRARASAPGYYRALFSARHLGLRNKRALQGAALELAVAAPIVMVVWLKSIDFGFRERLQPISGRSPSRQAHRFRSETRIPNTDLLDESLRSRNAKTCRAVALSEGGRQTPSTERETLMLIPSKTNRPVGLTFSSADANASFVKE